MRPSSSNELHSGRPSVQYMGFLLGVEGHAKFKFSILQICRLLSGKGR